MRIVVAPDKFKGTLTSSEAARAMVAGARAVIPSADVSIVPVSDGGEGFARALLSTAGGETHNVVVQGPLGDPATASLGYTSEGAVVIESAQVCGLGVVSERKPLAATTAGVGELIRRALDDPDTTSVVVGVGGSATTDGGTGAATALGWRFLDDRGHDLGPGGGELSRLHAIDGSGAYAVDRSVVAACDVTNPLVGPRGSAAVFAPQKGATRAEVATLACGLERLAEVVRAELGLDIAHVVHGGAGGGLGAGLHAFVAAQLVPGFDYVAAQTGLASTIHRADVVLTGEGRLDATTGGGKVVSGVIRLADETRARTIVVAGQIASDAMPRIGAHVTIIDLVERFGANAWASPATCLADATAEALATASGG